MQAAIQAIVPFGVSPIVRIPAGEPWMIKRALDAGAHGIAVPMVSTPVCPNNATELIIQEGLGG